ncbi:MAG: ATP-NAD kinase [Candidatus Abyssobacteria bacterium SURF_5]|uniref:ATP-NAD kinase n=1 Tax=Abyssobacteria bacterium (strain SURF_5) TaxID=2093360 RepID=A0A3A4NK60_ABYX5|nr:MAG: ATP-NAD kinase [Candidatus Abyssubacteria bacterium SURF_5]
MVKKVGLIVNPIAGMGGRVGLKGTDGSDILEQARRLGAQPEAPARAVEALRALVQSNIDVEILTYSDEMGEHECRRAGLRCTVAGRIRSGKTTADDTKQAAAAMAAAQVDLILFAGGDGTARNILDAIGQEALVLGIPAGVKIHSAVFAVTPRLCGQVAGMFLSGKVKAIREAEVMDIDEEAFRNGAVSARLYGYLLVPDERRFVQGMKAGGIRSENAALQGIAAEVIAGMTADDFYIIGPGTTTRAVMERLGLKNTLLGIDVIRNRQLVLSDVNEQQLLEITEGNPAKIVVTIIGGQGHVFGRGNQQLSPEVIRRVGKDNIIIIAPKEKVISLGGRPLLVDTGDEALNQDLSGYVRIVSGYKDYLMYKIG